MCRALRRPTPSIFALSIVLTSTVACSTGQAGGFVVEDVRIQRAFTEGVPVPQAAVVRLMLANCKGIAQGGYRVAADEGRDTVKVTVTGPVWQGGNQASCADEVEVRLQRPLGERILVDGSDGENIAATDY
jgi:hypothetical protein